MVLQLRQKTAMALMKKTLKNIGRFLIEVDLLKKELAKKENVSVYPDGKEPLSWTQKMNNIKNRAEGAPRAYIQVA